MKYFYLILLFIFCIGCTNTKTGQPENKKKIVLIAGKKSHGPKQHEYIKTIRLIKGMLQKASNVSGISCELVYNGWPEDPSILDDADLILMISDGQDGDLFSPVPFMYPDRMAIMEKQMKRGCGFSVIHFSTFAPNEWGEEILEWGGGYFDWQDDEGERNWYSQIKILDTTVQLASPDHPISNGVRPEFSLKDEFYYNIRFRENDPRLVPVLSVPALEGDQSLGGVVAWAVEREDGGRGFSTTTNHFFATWWHPEYRKMMLNGIVWAAGGEVPPEGVEAPFLPSRTLTLELYGAERKGLLLTGDDHPAHNWQETTPLIKEALEKTGTIYMDVSTDIEDLQYYDLEDYDFLVLNYCNWKDSTGLSDISKDRLMRFVSYGRGLIVLHFANGAFHYSLPHGEGSDWPGYRDLVNSVWDHDNGSAHDKFGKFLVKPTTFVHPITLGMNSFEIEDELYYNQKSKIKRLPLLVAFSKDTKQDEPLAWAYEYGRGGVFQMLLGHSEKTYQHPEIQQMLLRAAEWVSGDL